VDLLAADATRVTGPLREPMRWPRDDGQIKAMLLHVDGAMIHPTVVMRSAFVRSCGIRYTAAMRTDADNDFYVQAMAAGARFHNLGEPLLDYHRHPGNVTNDPLLRQRCCGSANAVCAGGLPGFFSPNCGASKLKH